MGIYWMDQEPLGRLLEKDAEFRALMDSIRQALDQWRAALPLDLVSPQVLAIAEYTSSGEGR